MSTPKGPFRLVTVNNAPERAKRLIGRVADQLKDRYEIIHVDNCACKFTTHHSGQLIPDTILTNSLAIDEVAAKVTEHKPDVLVSPSKSGFPRKPLSLTCCSIVQRLHVD